MMFCTGVGKATLTTAVALLASMQALAEPEPGPQPQTTGTETSSEAQAQTVTPAWATLGLMRVRDMTPFGLSRLDMLPAHAVIAQPGTFAFEFNFTYQNTWALSENVENYLEARGIERGPLTQQDIDSIVALPGEAYLVDGEFGLADLTLHYRATRHWGFYATIPFYFFGGGALDSTIESFHDGVGFGNAGRNFVPRNQFQAIVDLRRAQLVLTDEPDNAFGDPVFGARYSLRTDPGKWNLVLEAAAKVPRSHEERLVSTGSPDYGVQLSLQRFFNRNALYLSLSDVYYSSPDTNLTPDVWIPTAIAGWETRISEHVNLILQVYASRSVVTETDLDELAADKIQATLGIQWLYRGAALRFGVTENLANFNNTPDVGVTLSIAKVFFARKN